MAGTLHFHELINIIATVCNEVAASLPLIWLFQRCDHLQPIFHFQSNFGGKTTMNLQSVCNLNEVMEAVAHSLW